MIRFRPQLLLLILTLQASIPCFAQSEPGDSDVEFRRLYVEQQRLSELVDGMIPMRRREFASLVEAINRNADAAGSTAASVTAANYQARFEGTQLVEGTGSFVVLNSVAGRSMVSLDPQNLALVNPRWADETQPIAHLGLNPQGRWSLICDRSGKLEFGWSLRGQQQGSGVVFQVALPPCPVNTLELELPDGWVPYVADAIIERLPRDATEPSRWRLEVGGTTEFELHVRRQGSAENALKVARQMFDYRLTEAGLELRASFQIQADEPLQEIVLDVSPRLRVATAELNDESLPVIVESSGRTVSIPLPRSIQGSDYALTLMAYAPLEIRRVWRLPTPKIRDADWIQGTATLEVPETLDLETLEPNGYLATSVDTLPSPLTGELRTFQAFRQDGFLALRLNFRPPAVDVSTGTTIRINNSTISARQVSRFDARHGERFVLDTLTYRDWIIDSVETDPPEALLSFAAFGSRQRRSRLRLRQPIDRSRTIRVIVQAHRRMPRTRADLNGRDFRPLVFAGSDAERRLVSLIAEPPLRLQLRRDGQLARLDPGELTQSQQELLEVPAGALVYHDGPEADSFLAQLKREDPRYVVRTTVEAIAKPGRLEQLFRLQCEPSSTPVSRILVHLSEGAPSPIAWRVSNEDSLSSRKLPNTNPADGEDWELTLRQPTLKPFEIQGVRQTDFEQSATVSLISVPEAVSQTAFLVVASDDGTSLSVDSGALRATMQTTDDLELLTARRFRYDPSNLSSVEVKRAGSEGRPHAVWIWASRIESQYRTRGDVTHEVILQIQNLGAASLDVQLPASASLQRVAIDGVRIVARPGAAGRLSIPLPAGKEFPRVRFTYEMIGLPLRAVQQVKSAWPEFSVPCLRKSWGVWLPPGFEVIARQNRQRDQNVTQSWSHRLWGVDLFPRDALSANAEGQTAGQLFRRPSARLLASLQEAQSDVLTQLTPDATWGQWLALFAAAMEERGRNVVVDPDALAGVGVTASLRFGTGSATRSDSLPVAAERLAFLAYRDVVVLTSRIYVASNDASWIGAVASIPVANTDKSLSSDDAGVSFDPVVAQDWDSLASADERGSELSLARAVALGWTRTEIRLDGPSQQLLWVKKTSVVNLVAWVLLLVTAASAACLWPGRPRRLALCTVASMVLPLLVPPDFVVLARSVFWGLLLATLLVVLRSRQKSKPVHTTSPMRGKGTSHTTQSVAVSVLVLLLGSVEWAEGQSPWDELLAGAKAVVIPIDEERKPVGEVLYVPPEFYDLLHRRAATASATPQAWLVTGATYRVNLKPRVGGDQNAVVTRLTAELQLEVFEDQTQVRIPMKQDGIEYLEMRRNGQVILPQWSESHLEFEVASAGTVGLELEIRPQLSQNSGREGFEITIPPVASARVELVAPLNLQEIQLETARGAVQKSSLMELAQQKVEAELGNADALRVAWAAAPADAAEGQIMATQRQWLRVEAEAIMLESQFEVSVQTGDCSSLEIDLPSGVRLDQLTADSPVSDVTLRDDGGIVLTLERSFEMGSRFVIEASFRLEDVSSVGRIRVPQLQLTTATITRTVLAVSSVENLDVSLITPGNAEQVSAGEFLGDWDDDPEPPLFVRRLPADTSEVMLEVNPRETPPIVDQATHVSAGLDHLKFLVICSLQADGGSRMQQRIRLPASVRMEDVRVTDSNGDRLLRYTLARRELVLFYETPLTGNYNVEFSGQLRTLDTEYDFELPRLQNVRLQSHDVLFYRQTDTIITSPQATRLTESQRQQAQAAMGTLHAVSPMEDTATGTTVPIRVKLNRPKLDADMVTRLQFVDGEWQVVVDLRATNVSGIVDSLRFGIPDSFVGPFECQPPMEIEVKPIPGEGGRVLSCRGPLLSRRPFRLTITGKLDLMADAVEAPEIRLVDFPSARQFIVLPTTLESQTLTWEVSGLQAQPLPAELGSADGASYLVKGPLLYASLSDSDRVAGVPRVHLADYTFASAGGRQFTGVATFDVEPSRQFEVDLVLEDGTQLVQAFVSGQPALMSSQAPNKWAVRLGHNQLPQRVQVVFTTELEKNTEIRGAMQLAAPRLGSLPVLTTLWTVETGAWTDAVQPWHLDAIVTSKERRAVRLGSARRLLQTASQLSTQGANVSFDLWQQQWSELNPMLASFGNQAENRGDAPLVQAGTFLWIGNAGGGTPLLCRFQGEMPRLLLREAPWESRQVVRQLSWFTGGILALAVAVWMTRRQPNLGEWLARNPLLIATLIAVLCSVLMTPTYVGWSLLFLCAAAGLRPIWRFRDVS